MKCSCWKIDPNSEGFVCELNSVNFRTNSWTMTDCKNIEYAFLLASRRQLGRYVQFRTEWCIFVKISGRVGLSGFEPEVCNKLAFELLITCFSCSWWFYSASIYPGLVLKNLVALAAMWSIYTGYSSVLPLEVRSTACKGDKLSSKFLSTQLFLFLCMFLQPVSGKLLCIFTFKFCFSILW